MHIKGRFHNTIFGPSWSPLNAALALMLALLFFILLLVLMNLTAQRAEGQTFKVIHNFTGGTDGFDPMTGLTLDKTGNLCGTTAGWGSGGNDCTHGTVCGTVFNLSPSGFLNTIHVFRQVNDGAAPQARVVFGPDGSLYGTTSYGGGCSSNGGCGVVFKLTPPARVLPTALTDWTTTVLYRFSGADGADPQGELVFDRDGSIYGTTRWGGPSNDGVVYKLAYSGGAWTESVLYTFTGGSDGGMPVNGVVLDEAGNLYGTTYEGGSGWWGVVFRLSPSGSGWQESVLHTFLGGDDGGRARGLVFDTSGNLYGTTDGVYPNADGTVFMLSPSGSEWTYSVIYNFTEGYIPGPRGLTLDPTGNLYGITGMGGSYGYGNVFKLTSGGRGWTYTDLHDFTGGLDGGAPLGNVMLDSSGNIYGTATEGGDPQWCKGYGGCGVVFEITP